jgi:hypothetical protein
MTWFDKGTMHKQVEGGKTNIYDMEQHDECTTLDSQREVFMITLIKNYPVISGNKETASPLGRGVH